MIQDQLGGAGLPDGERKVSFSGGVLKGLPSSSSPSLSSSTTTTTTITSSENLRCPRCDSSNTKFCYYNNYNLTQPRHFCKTCRRYWTKGGALRNIPMGGSCRKNKHTTTSTTVGKLTHAKVKSSSFHIVKSNLGSGFDQEPPTNTILWGWPQTSQLLAFLRGTQNPNLNPNSISNSVTIKDEGATIGVTGAQNAGTLTLDPLGQGPIGLCSSFGRNNQQQEQQQCLLFDEVQTTGIQELYQRLRSSENYFTDHSPPLLSSVPSMSSSSSSVLEQVSIAGGELGCWNSSFSWSNLPATNGAFS